MSKDLDSKLRLDEGRSGCHHIWMLFGPGRSSSYGLISNDNAQLQLTNTESHGRHPDIRSYRRSYLQFDADDQSRVLLRPISSTLQRIAREAFPLPQRSTAAPFLWTMHSSSSIVAPSLPGRQYIL